MATRRELIEQKAKRDLREKYVELCYHYPQYKLDDFSPGGKHYDYAIGNINLMINFARKQYYQSKLDDMVVARASQDKKGYKTLKDLLNRNIKKLKALL